MNKRKTLIATNIALAIASSSFVGYVGYSVHKDGREREQRVEREVQRFHGCPEQFGQRRECLSERQSQELFRTAERAHESGLCNEEAALAFVRLSQQLQDELEAKAREMGGRCSEEIRGRVDEALRVRREAVRRVVQNVAPARPAVSADAGVPDAAPPQADAGAAVVDAGAADAAPAQTNVTITFRTNPAGVEVLMGDESRCTTNPECTVSVQSGNWGLEFQLRKPGYRSRTETVTPDQDRTVEVTLERQSTERRRPPRRDPQPPQNPGTRPGPAITSPD
jgi:hypothetical protein